MNRQKYEIKYEVNLRAPPSISVPTHFYKIVVAENFFKDNNRNKVEKGYVAYSLFYLMIRYQMISL